MAQRLTLATRSHDPSSDASLRTRCFEPRQSVPEANVIVFVHGLGGSAEVWDTLFDGFARPHRLVSLEMPWSGRQGSGWSACSSADWIRDALAQVGTPAAMIVAHSFGANAVLEYLDQYGPRGVTRVALLAPFFDVATPGVPIEERFSLHNFQELITDGFRHAAGTRRVRADILASMARRIRERVAGEGWAEFVRVFRRTPSLRTSRFTLPCLVMTGANDVAAPVDAAAVLSNALPDSRLVRLTDCGHFAMTEQPRQVLDALNAFAALAESGELCAAS